MTAQAEKAITGQKWRWKRIWQSIGLSVAVVVIAASAVGYGAYVYPQSAAAARARAIHVSRLMATEVGQHVSAYARRAGKMAEARLDAVRQVQWRSTFHATADIWNRTETSLVVPVAGACVDTIKQNTPQPLFYSGEGTQQNTHAPIFDCLMSGPLAIHKMPEVRQTAAVRTAGAPKQSTIAEQSIALAVSNSQPIKQIVQSFTVSNNLLALRAHADCSAGTSLTVVAHEDDDLLFINPDIQADITASRCLRTVFMTAGDAGQAADYWKEREAGAKAAYAAMFGVQNEWTDVTQNMQGAEVHAAYLTKVPRVSLVFLGLPDGDIKGEGFGQNSQESLAKLLSGDITVIDTVEGAFTTPHAYTMPQLLTLLGGIMRLDAPDVIRTLDPVGQASGDHADHAAVGELTRIASGTYASKHTLTTYAGYPNTLLDPNLSAEEITAKQNIFLIYAQHDGAVCHSNDECATTSTYGNYVMRRYPLTSMVSGQ